MELNSAFLLESHSVQRTHLLGAMLGVDRGRQSAGLSICPSYDY